MSSREPKIRGQAKRLARGVVRRADRVLGGRLYELRRTSRLASRRWRGKQPYLPGLLSVVVPAYGVEDYLEECLDSLRFQEHRSIEIVVVDDGSPDNCAEIAQRIAREDRRVRLVRQPNGGLSAARNTGVEHAVGEFLAFVDADDTVALRAFSAPIDALRESGSDLAITHYDRLGKDGKLVPAGGWIRRAHEERRLGVTLETFPAAMVNAVAWSKVYRRTFWDAADLSFPVGRLYEDQPVSMEAFAKARAFDVLPTVGVHWRVRGDRSSLSQSSATVKNLAEHNEAVRVSLAALRENGHPAAADARVLQLLANNMPHFVRHLAIAGDQFWELLRTGIAELTQGITPATYRREVPALDKVLYELIVTGRRDDATAILENHSRDVRRYPSRVAADGVHVVLPYSEQVADNATLLADRQLDPIHRMLRARWEADGTLQLDGWAHLSGIDLAVHAQDVTVTLCGAGGFRRDLSVTHHLEPRADLAGQHLYCDYTPSGFTATLDPAGLPDGEYRFEVHVAAAGVRRTATLSQPPIVGSAAVAHGRVLPDGRSIVLNPGRRDPGAFNPLLLRVETHPAWARAARIDGGVLLLDFVGAKPTRVQVTRVGQTRPLVSAKPTRTASGWQVRLDLAGAHHDEAGRGTEANPLRIQAVTDAGPVPLLAPAGMTESPGYASEPQVGDRVLSRARTGALELLDWLPVALDYEITDDLLTVTVAHRGPLPGHPVLRSKAGDVRGQVEPAGHPGRSRLRFGLTRTYWGHRGLALPSDRYLIGFPDLNTDDNRGGWQPLAVAPDLLDTIPTEHLGGRYRARTSLTPTAPPGLALYLEPPLADDEIGARNQRRLQESARVVRAEDDAAFFRSLYGEVTNCNALGVHRELLRRGSRLRLQWSVQDHSVPVPEGGVGLVERTTEWHQAIARARYHMVNVHQLDWFTKPDGQVMIETMHGYPYKVMGHEWWDKGGFPRNQVESFDRRARDWDYFVSPASYATPLLQAAFLEPAGATAEILEIGYPRNDILLSPEGEQVRRRTRELLGIGDQSTVVLYAPTFRDYLSADDMTAKRVDFLDPEEIVGALGETVTVLLRGHAFHSRAKDGALATSAAIIDVTDYPDINDLILASDVGVLDYSSLRFDYGVTDKPMIFLVPDLEKYNAVRGGVIAYEPTAPGPFARSTAEVVSWLRDPTRLAREYAGARSRFRAEYADLEDGNASRRLVDAVFRPRGDVPD